MFHANTPQHKDVILSNLSRPDGVVRVVFATVALGMGINLRDVNTIIHYGAPQSIEDYFQESGRGGRSSDPAWSVVYWKPIDCRVKKLSSTRDQEVAAVRHYLENDISCRRQWLLQYFDPSFTTSVRDPLLCCDVCAKKYSASLVCYFIIILYCIRACIIHVCTCVVLHCNPSHFV